MAGKVYLIGAGPGDPDLITVKGLRLLQSADVVVYDRLIPHGLLDETRVDCELIDAGKAPAKHRLSQENINHIIVNRALAGLTVARLKGGDPFVFGRGGEEALACHEAGIPFEVVPGVSSAFAVPAHAGIPLTHRHISSAFTVITGHEDPAKNNSSINYQALAQFQGTLVILMGVAQLSHIAARLIEHGMVQDTPAACVEWGATQKQRVVTGTLSTLPELIAEQRIQPPATIIVGDVVTLREQGLKWFEGMGMNLLQEQIHAIPLSRLPLLGAAAD